MSGAAPAARPFVVGVISDTHGELPDAVAGVFAGVDAIVHAGDVGGGTVLEELSIIAPVTAVCGIQGFYGEQGLPPVANVLLGGVRFLVGHAKDDLLAAVHPVAARADVVVTGHSHRARAARHKSIWYVNPGSASEGRGAPRSVAIVTVHEDGRIEPLIRRLP